MIKSNQVIKAAEQDQSVIVSWVGDESNGLNLMLSEIVELIWY